MLGVMFNHYIWDDPYKRTSVEKGINRLDELCKRLNRHLFTSVSRKNRSSFIGNDYADDYVVVHYSGELSDAEKAEIADCIKEALTLKKTVYKGDDLPEILVVFSKVGQSDYFCFNVK